MRQRFPRPHRDDRGSAAAEFVMVGMVLLLLTFGVIQVGLVLHARNVLAADAAEGARAAAGLAQPIAAGAKRAQELARGAAPGLARDVACTAQQVSGDGGVPLVEVACRADLKLAFLPLGSIHLSATGRSVKEAVG